MVPNRAPALAYTNARKKFGSAFTRHGACTTGGVQPPARPSHKISASHCRAVMRLLGACPNGLVHHGAFLPPYPGLRTVAYNVVPNRAVATPAGVHQIGTQPSHTQGDASGSVSAR